MNLFGSKVGESQPQFWKFRSAARAFISCLYAIRTVLIPEAASILSQGNYS